MHTNFNRLFHTDLKEKFCVVFYNKKTIGTFYLHNASRKTIANELAVLFTDQKQIKTTQNYYEQVVPYLAEVYGNTNMETIRDIIKNDLNIPLNIMD